MAEPALRSPGTTVALARQGRRYLLATGGGGIVALWDVTDPAHASYLGDDVVARKGDSEPDIKVAFSPDGEALAALGSDDGNIWLWSLTNLRHISLTGDFTGRPDGLLTVGPGGRMVADTVDGQIVGAASQTTLWTRVDPRRPWRVTHVASSIAGATATALDPVAPILAAGGTNGVIRLWSVPSSGPPTPLITLSGTTAPQLTLAFSPEGNILASADSDGNIHLWDISDVHAPVTIGEFTAPAGSTLIGVSQPARRGRLRGRDDRGDGGFSTWDIDASTLISRVCASSGDPITAAQWNQYVPGQPYSPPCAAGG